MRTTRAAPVSGQASVLLYRLIYKTKLMLLAVGILLFSILLQPIDFVYASETEASAEVATEDVVAAEPEPEPEPEPQPEPEVVEEEVVPEEVAVEEVVPDNVELEEPAGDESLDDVANNLPAEGADEVVADVVESPGDQEVVAPDSSTGTETQGGDEDSAAISTVPDVVVEPIVPESVSSTSEDYVLASSTPAGEEAGEVAELGGGSSSGGSTVDDFVSSTPTTSADGVEEAAATTSTTTREVASVMEGVEQPSEQVADPLVPVEENTSLDTLLSDASTSADVSASSTNLELLRPRYIESTIDPSAHAFGSDQCVTVGDGSYYCSKGDNRGQLFGEKVYAAKDVDGDYEVYVANETRTLQITNNLVDDQAPEYDTLSNRLAWHRLINGNYQVIIYDLRSETETQLTYGQANSMEPSVEGDYIVWQAWDGTDWEIMLYHQGSSTQLTDNEAPDLAPHIRGEYIIWNTIDVTGKPAANVYSLSTGVTELIQGVEGGAVMNPRFVLVYDTKYDNGDVITTGYDVKGGKLMNLAALPAELPVDIPDSDPTEETRALIQNKSSKEEVDELLVPDSDTPTIEPDPATTTPEVGETDIDLSVDVPIKPFELTEYDVVVTDFATTSAQVDRSTTSQSLVE